MRIIFLATLSIVGTWIILMNTHALESIHAATASESQQALQQYNDAYHEEEPVRGFIRLYLRVAGVVWVAVEWIAAILLYKGYRMLRPHFTEDTLTL